MDNPDTGNIGHTENEHKQRCNQEWTIQTQATLAENEHKQRCNQEWTIQTQATLVTKQKMNTNKAKKKHNTVN